MRDRSTASSCFVSGHNFTVAPARRILLDVVVFSHAANTAKARVLAPEGHL